MQQEILSRIDALAAKLGVAADEVYRVLIRQAQVEVWESAALLVAAIVAWGLTVWLFDKASKVYDDLFVFLVAVITVMSLLLTAFAIDGIFQIPTLLLNPEYWALQEILSVLGK